MSPPHVLQAFSPVPLASSPLMVETAVARPHPVKSPLPWLWAAIGFGLVVLVGALGFGAHLALRSEAAPAVRVAPAAAAAPAALTRVEAIRQGLAAQRAANRVAETGSSEEVTELRAPKPAAQRAGNRKAEAGDAEEVTELRAPKRKSGPAKVTAPAGQARSRSATAKAAKPQVAPQAPAPAPAAAPAKASAQRPHRYADEPSDPDL